VLVSSAINAVLVPFDVITTRSPPTPMATREDTSVTESEEVCPGEKGISIEKSHFRRFKVTFRSVLNRMVGEGLVYFLASGSGIRAQWVK